MTKKYTIKADLHMHGPIGFQDYWLNKQNYADKNLAKEITDNAMKREIGMTAITSEAFKIDSGGIHDRFNYLIKEAKSLPKTDYTHDKLGNKEIAFAIERKKEGKKLIIVNGQTAIVKEKGKRLDHLVIGSNKIPNKKSLKETINYCKSKGMIQIAEHPLCTSHLGIGEEILLDSLEEYDAIEGHNSQLILPSITFFKNYSHKLNNLTKEFAESHKKPWIATSDAHRIKDVGLSTISFSSLV